MLYILTEYEIVQFRFNHIPDYISVSLFKRIDPAFARKIMLAVVSVNQCDYCSWFYPKMASFRLSSTEIKKILDKQLDEEIDDYEIVALTYAQHYAETDGKPDTEMTKKLIDFYGRGVSDDIMLYIRRAMSDSLSGNMIDAFFSRLKGETVPKSNFWIELVMAATSIPFLLPFLPFIKIKRK